MKKVLLLGAVAFALFSACTADSSFDKVEIVEATFAGGIDEKEGEAIDPRSEFAQGEDIYLLIKFKGRPREGIIKTVYYFRDNKITETSVDLSDINEGMIFSFGQFTFAYFKLTLEGVSPIGEGYRAEVFCDEELLDTYEFSLLSPEGAIESVVNPVSVSLSKNVDANFNPVTPSNNFFANETVYLVGRGDLGTGSWIEANWYVLGEFDKAGTKFLTAKENTQNSGFAFHYLPEGGWPTGEHYVALIMNGKEIIRYTFTVAEKPAGGLGSAMQQ